MRFVRLWALALLLACPAPAAVVAGRVGTLPASWVGVLGSLPSGVQPPVFLSPLFKTAPSLESPALTPVAVALERMGVEAQAFQLKPLSVQTALLDEAGRLAVLEVAASADGALKRRDAPLLLELHEFHSSYLDEDRRRQVAEQAAAAGGVAFALAEKTAEALEDSRRPPEVSEDLACTVSKCPFHRLLGLSPSTKRTQRHAEVASAAGRIRLGTGVTFREPVLRFVWEGLRSLWRDAFAGRTPPPKVKLWTLIKLGLNNMKNPVAAFEALHRSHGDAAYMKLPTGDRFIVVSDPEVVDHVLRGTEKTFEKSALLTGAFGRLTGDDTIFLGKGAHWLSRRKMMQPYFTRKALHGDESVGEMLAVIDDAMDDLSARAVAQGGAVDVKVSDEMTAVTMNVILGLLFKSRLSREAMFGEIMPAFQEVTSWLVPEALNPFGRSLSALPKVFKGQRRLAKAYETLHIFAARLQDESGSGEEDYLLKALLAAKAEGKISDAEVRQEILTMVLAGHETTSSTLAWALSSLSRDPASMERLLKEIEETTGGRPPTPAQLRDGFPFLDMVVSETLRLYSPAYVLFRKASADASIATKSGEFFIPAGTHVVLPTYVTQRREKQWAKSGFPAGEFHPERFSTENIKARGLETCDLRTFSFGGGQRLCVGSHLSILETKLILIRLLQRFTLRPAHPGAVPRMVSDSSVKIEDGFPARLDLR